MSRSGYDHDGDYDYSEWGYIRWRGAVTSAIRGRRGQAFLKELLAALEALPEKRLERDSFDRDGGVCALGAVGRARGLDMTVLDRIADDENSVSYEAAAAFGIPNALAAEIMEENDDAGWRTVSPEMRWQRMHEWVKGLIK